MSPYQALQGRHPMNTLLCVQQDIPFMERLIYNACIKAQNSYI